MADAHKNFAYAVVLTAPSPATSGTSLVVSSGQGALFPTAPFNATVWPAAANPTSLTAEIIRVGARSGDTLSSITRAQEGTSARTILVGDQISANLTVKALTDIETDTRWTDARTPTAHATTHKSGGTDAIRIDELAAPTDVTTLDASTTAHGLVPKLPNDATKFYNGTGGYTVPTLGTPSAHATSHKHGGSDEVATATPAANAIPKAGAGGQLAIGFLASGTPTGGKFVRDDGTLQLPSATVAAKAVDQSKMADVIPRVGRVSNMWGDANWTVDPNTYRITGMGIGAVHAYYVVNGTPTAPLTLFAANGVSRTLVYKKFHELVDASESTAGAADPANDTVNDPSASALSANSYNWLVTNHGWSFGKLTRAGATLSSAGEGSQIADLRDINYQQAATAAVAGFARRYGVDSLFVDTFGDIITDMTANGALPDGYESDEDWYNHALIPFARAVFPALQAHGLYIAPNIAGHAMYGYTSLESTNRRDSTMRHQRMLAPYVNAFVGEYFAQYPPNATIREDDSIAITGSAVNGSASWWQGMMRVQQNAYSLNRDYWAIVYGPASEGNAAALRYAFGSFLLAWDGKAGGGMIYFPGNTTDTSPTYRWDTGAPTRIAMQIGTKTYKWARPFVNGVLRVNTDPSSSQSISYNGVARTIAASDASFDAT